MDKSGKSTTPWSEEKAAQGSFRSIFKWGLKDHFKAPSTGFYRVIQEELGLVEKPDTGLPCPRGEELVPDSVPPAISGEDVAALVSIVGEENVGRDTYTRLKHATGKSMEDILKLRQGRIEAIPDLVIHPRGKKDVASIVAFCNGKKIPVHVFGGGSSVTLGLMTPNGGVTLVMGTHMNRMMSFSEANQTITVEPGMMGPDYEALLNQAPKTLGAAHRYTGGHFPQSFEFSSVGGWVVTLGAGQASSYYGDACDLVISQEYVTPAGSFKTLDYPGTATGPRVNDIMMGSEGTLGVLVAVTMKVFRYTPENARPFTFILPDWESAVSAVREISQGEFGMPAILRISDPEETDIAMKMYGIEPSMISRFMDLRGYKAGRRCILMGQAEGERNFSRQVRKNVVRVCRRFKGMSLTGYPMKKWRHGRFSDAYMREPLNDAGVLIDTLETSVTWESIHRVYTQVRRYIKSHPGTICMTHASHFYAQGTNLYFIFITRMKDLEDFRTFQRGIITAIAANGGSLSHHHGVGRLMGPWMEDHLGPEQMGILRAIKRHLDPNNILNPGGTLGL